MRSFEQYINETRQNYIFGGTDNRNGNVTLKTLLELEKGDMIYYWHFRSSNIGSAYTITKVSEHDDEIVIYCNDEISGNQNFYMSKDRISDDGMVYIYEDTTSVSGRNKKYVVEIISVDKDRFIEEVKKENPKFSKSDIVE